MSINKQKFEVKEFWSLFSWFSEEIIPVSKEGGKQKRKWVIKQASRQRNE